MKIRWLLLLTLLISACTPATPTSDPPANKIPPPTETPVPSEDEESVEEPDTMQEPIPTETPAPTATPFACAKLISPENGLELPAVGKVTFAWEPVDGADSYLLQFTLPNGTIVTFETDQTTKDRYMEAFGVSGEFEWNVAALDVNGNEICASISFKFTKPEKSRISNGDAESGNQCPPGFSGSPPFCTIDGNN